MRGCKLVLLVAFIAMCGGAPKAQAQWAVVDVGAIAQLIQQIATLREQLETARNQLDQARRQLADLTKRLGDLSAK